MEERFEHLGQNILHAARMAVAAHLQEGVELTSNRGQRFALHRAGSRIADQSCYAWEFATDEAVSAFAKDGADR